MGTFKQAHKLAKGGARPGAGRKRDEIKRAAKAMLEEEGPQSMLFLAKVRNGQVEGMTSDNRVRAAVFLAEQWAGKAKQQVEIGGSMNWTMVLGPSAANPIQKILDHADSLRTNHEGR